MYNGIGLVLVAAAILLLMTPCLVAGGPCDCSTCQSYSDQKSRCLCCVYHGVGGKRAAADNSRFYLPDTSISPSVHFFLSSGLGKVAASSPKDGATDINRQWLPVGGSMTSHPELEREENIPGETEFGLEPVLAVKTSRGSKPALRGATTIIGLRRLLLGGRLGPITTEE